MWVREGLCYERYKIKSQKEEQLMAYLQENSTIPYVTKVLLGGNIFKISNRQRK
jgi:hypothetical protein